MSRILYADTGAFLALIYAGDSAHPRVAAHFRTLRSAGDRLVTSEPVITETVARLRYDAGLAHVEAFRDALAAAVAQGSLSIRESGEELRRAAFGVLTRFADLHLSYADAVGAVVARAARADAVFGLDNDFRVMGFVVEP